MQLGLKLVANLATGAANPVKPSLTTDVRRDLVKQTLKLGETMGRHVGTIKVGIDEIIMIALKVVMPNTLVYSSHGVIVPFAVEGLDGGAVLRKYVALYNIMASEEQMLSNLREAGRVPKRITLLSYEQVGHPG